MAKENEPSAALIAEVVDMAKRAQESGSTSDIRENALDFADVVVWLAKSREGVIRALGRADKRGDELEAKLRSAREALADGPKVGTHEPHLENAGAPFDPASPQNLVRHNPAAGEVLPPNQRATPFRDKVPGIDR